MAQTDRVQGLVGNTGIKTPCRAATTAAITLSGEQTIDGVACVTGDRVLVKTQTSGVDNGIYVVDTGTWDRAHDCDGAYDLVAGTLIYVRSGTANSGFWYVSTTGTITVGTTSLAFVQASSVLAVISAFAQTLLDDADADSFVQTLVAGLSAETAPATDDVVLVGDTSESKGNKMTVSNLLKIVNALTAETAPAVNDELLVYDLSETAANKMTFENFLKVLNALTEDTAPDAAADFLLEYDASGSGVKKVLPNRFAATQAQQETGTSNDAYVTPGRFQYHVSAAKGWCIFDGSGTPSIKASYNVLSLTDNGTGDWTVNWTSHFSSTNYAVVGMTVAGSTAQSRILSVNSTGTGISTAGIRIMAHTDAATLVDATWNSIAAFGDI